MATKGEGIDHRRIGRARLRRVIDPPEEYDKKALKKGI